MKRICIYNLILLFSLWLSSALANEVMTVTVTPSSPTAIISLPANPSTGYQWQVNDYNSQLMYPPTSRYVFEKKIPGASGYTIWQFKFKKSAFIKSQITSVYLEYKRPWENTPGKKQIIRIQINVGSK